jgi:hypothetical protein
LESCVSSESKKAETTTSGKLKLGVVAVASVLAAGLATAWWYRKTLAKLNSDEGNDHNPDFRISESDASAEPRHPS